MSAHRVAGEIAEPAAQPQPGRDEAQLRYFAAATARAAITLTIAAR